MKLIRCHIDNFGKINNFEYDLIAKYYPQITVSSIDVLLDTNNNAVIIDISYTYTDSDLNEETIRLELFNKEVI